MVIKNKINRKGIIAFILLTFSLTAQEKTFVAIVCSYNNEQWAQKNLNSLLQQNYTNLKILYINDCSTDATEAVVKNYLQKNDPHHRVTYIRNKIRKYKLHNLYHAIYNYCNDNDIIIEVDGDDWLLSTTVFEHLNKLYQNPNIWMTYGGFVMWPRVYTYLKAHTISQKTITNNQFRSFHRKGYIFMALRSFYCWLFKKIKKEDLMHNKNFFKRSSDIATMIPMFEMAGNRFHHITDKVYLYNTKTGHNDFVVDAQGQRDISSLILKKERYTRLP